MDIYNTWHKNYFYSGKRFLFLIISTPIDDGGELSSVTVL